MSDPLSDDLAQACDVLGARIAASLGDKLGVPYREGKPQYVWLLRRDTERRLAGQPTAEAECDYLTGQIRNVVEHADKRAAACVQGDAFERGQAAGLRAAAAGLRAALTREETTDG